jgi:hypothetical protein
MPTPTVSVVAESQELLDVMQGSSELELEDSDELLEELELELLEELLLLELLEELELDSELEFDELLDELVGGQESEICIV